MKSSLPMPVFFVSTLSEKPPLPALRHTTPWRGNDVIGGVVKMTWMVRVAPHVVLAHAPLLGGGGVVRNCTLLDLLYVPSTAGGVE